MIIRVFSSPLAGSASNVMSSGGYAIPFPRQQHPAAAAGTMPAMVTQATSPISPSSPLVAAARVRSPGKESEEEDELESLTSNEAVLEGGGGKEALHHSLPKVRKAGRHSCNSCRLQMQKVSPFQRFQWAVL